MRTHDGTNVSGDLQISPKTTGLQSSFISVGRVADSGNIIVFSGSGGTIFNEVTGNQVEFERAGGVYRLKADTSAKRAAGTGGTKMLMGFEQESAGLAEAQLATPGKIVCLSIETEVEPHGLSHLSLRSWRRHCVCAKGKESPGQDGTPISIPAGCDGLTTAFFGTL